MSETNRRLAAETGTRTRRRPPHGRCHIRRLDLRYDAAENSSSDDVLPILDARDEAFPEEGRPVLVVDDDADVAYGTSLRLQATGYATLIAHDGREGIEVARSVHPTAIVLDVRMPRMSGLKALEKLQQDARTQDIPVIMLSASLVDQQAALDAGARYYVTKPFQPDVLVAAVEAAIAESYHD